MIEQKKKFLYVHNSSRFRYMNLKVAGFKYKKKDHIECGAVNCIKKYNLKRKTCNNYNSKCVLCVRISKIYIIYK